MKQLLVIAMNILKGGINNYWTGATYFILTIPSNKDQLR